MIPEVLKGLTGIKSMYLPKVCIGMMIFLILTGCSNPGKSKNRYEDYDNITAGELKPVTLNFYSMDYGLGSGIDDEIKNTLREIESKLSDSIKVKPQFHLIDHDKYEQEIKTLVSSGKDIDAVACYSPYQFDSIEIFKDISKDFPDYAPDYYKELMSSKAGEEYLYNASIDGKLCIIPYNSFNCPRYCVAARKDLVDKYAKKGLKTLEDYGEFLKAVKENDEELIPGIVFSRHFFEAYMKGNGYYEAYAAYIYNSWNNEGRVTSFENAGEILNAYNMFRDWRTKEYAPRNPEAYYDPFYISNNMIASQLINIDELRILKLEKLSDEYEYGLYPLYTESTHLLSGAPTGIGIASGSTNAERVLMFIEWLHKSQENYDLFRYGVEGRNYNLDGEKLVYSESTKEIPYAWDIVTGFFSDYRYERTSLFDIEEYRGVVRDASLKNVKTPREIPNPLRDMEKDEMERLNSEFESLSPVFEQYHKNMSSFFNDMDMGYFSITPQDLKEIQKEAGIDRVIDYYKKYVPDKDKSN